MNAKDQGTVGKSKSSFAERLSLSVKNPSNSFSRSAAASKFKNQGAPIGGGISTPQAHLCGTTFQAETPRSVGGFRLGLGLRVYELLK